MVSKVYIELHSDNDYIIPTVVTLTSLLKNKDLSSEYDIRFLGNNLSAENIKLMEKIGIKTISHKSDFSEISNNHRYVSSTDLFKFDLPEVLSDVDKLIYLDSDIIVQKDLTDLFNIELGDNYIAAVKDMYVMYTKRHNIEIGVNDYFNAGVMVLNLKKMREDKIKQKLIDYKLHKDSGLFISQDALNYVFMDKIIWLSPKYNFMITSLQNYTKNEICDFYNINKSEYEEIKKNASIIHIAGNKKPWEYKNCIGHKLWKEYFDISIVNNIEFKFKKIPLLKIAIHNLASNLKKILRIAEIYIFQRGRKCKY